MNENREFDTEKMDNGNAKRNALRASLLAVAVLGVPAALAVLAVICWHLFVKPPAPAADAAEAPQEQALPSNVVAALPPAPFTGILAEREAIRRQGEPIDGINLKIWMRQVNHPLPIFRVDPPVVTNADRPSWRWAFAQDVRYVVAFSAEANAAGRRSAGLYDLVGEEWIWKSLLPWPQRHERPFVVDGRLLLAYPGKGRRFMLQVAKNGAVASIDALDSGKAGAASAAVLGGTNSEFVVDNVRFTLSQPDGALAGFAIKPFPGFHDEKRVLEVFGETRPALDEQTAREYADILANLGHTVKSRPLPVPYLALRARLCIANQAWGFAVRYMERMEEIQQTDSRAPRANPLLLARCLILSGRAGEALSVCQKALRDLANDDSAYNGKARAEFNRLYQFAAGERRD